MDNPLQTVISQERSAKKAVKQAVQVKKAMLVKKGKMIKSLVNEGKHINASLFYLCQVIQSLAKGDQHVPYRNSNLTKLLRSSLGGNAKTCLICTATPIYSQYEMTAGTLRFGDSAITIRNKAVANVHADKNTEILAAYQNDVDDLRKKLEQAN